VYHFEGPRLVPVAVLAGLIWLWLGKLLLLSVCYLKVGLVRVLRIVVCTFFFVFCVQVCGQHFNHINLPSILKIMYIEHENCDK
jgi:hypothetical protein